jgi:acetyltransferase-like isoleucine patch superfamily enzyme
MQSAIVRIFAFLRRRKWKFKGFLFKLFLTSFCGCKVGINLLCKKWPRLREIPFRNITISDNVVFGYNITLDIGKNGNLIIEENVNLTQDIIISSNKKIIIKENTLIAENVSIRDSDHSVSIEEIISKQEMKSYEVIIGKDVWIGAGVRILKGSNIPDKVVIGANSVVTKNNAMENHGIYVGNPLRLIKTRD